MDAEHKAVTDSMRELGAELERRALAVLAALRPLAEAGRALAMQWRPEPRRQPIPGTKAYRRVLRR